MARGRMLSGTIGGSRKFAALPGTLERMFYLMIIPHADKAGRMEADPDWLKATAFMRISEITTDNIPSMLEACANVGLIMLYACDDIPVLEVVDFEKHNTPHHREPESEFCAPPADRAAETPTAATSAATPEPEKPVQDSPPKHASSMPDASAKHAASTNEASADVADNRIEVELELEEELEDKHSSSGLDLEPASGAAAGLTARRERINYQAFLDSYNNLRGSLPEATALNESRRSRLRRFLKDVPPGADPLELFANAVRQIASDEFYIERKYNLDTLLAKSGRVIQRAEQYTAAKPKSSGHLDQYKELGL